jgi:Na+-driven multidrug efflux pump
MIDNEQLFTRTKPLRLFAKLAIPGAVSMFMSSVYILVDGILVGNLLGKTAFAAINLAFPFVLFNFSLTDLIGVGSSVSISILLGKKQDGEANRVFSASCLLILLCSAIMGGMLYFAAPFLFGIMGATGGLADLSTKYLRVFAVASPVTTVVFAADNYLRICGKIHYSMNLNIAMSLLNAVFEFVFLFVFHWNVWAAALANCYGMFICAIIALYPFVMGKLQLKFTKPQIDFATVKDIAAAGSPGFLQSMSGRLTSLVMNSALIRFGGTTAVSIYGVLMYSRDTIQPILYGMNDSIQPAIGYNWGAGNRRRIIETGYPLE